MKRLLSTLTLAVVAALALTACSSTTSSSTFDKADVTFAQSMIPHHEQAVQMATTARTRASSAQVRKLATEIEAAQGPEISTMKGWLSDWGTSPSGDASTGGMSGMPGMMSTDDMTRLDKATGHAFDTMFLTMMIAHHTGAIQMARTERSTGENARAKALAKKIESAQTAEIARMKKLLGS